MLNISQNKVDSKIDKSLYQSLFKTESLKSGKVLMKLFISLFALGFVTMLLPWTQNINARGAVTTLRPEQRPQTIHSAISGRIEKWYVQEGDFVNKGDTVLFISEIKNEYLDPNLIGNTKQQVDAKELSVTSYMEKVKSLDNQIDALLKTSELKWKQAENKIKQAELMIISDSINLEAKRTNYAIAQTQYNRIKKLNESGLKSLTALEQKKQSMQKAQSEMISSENKFLTSKNKVVNAQIEQTSLQAQYREKIFKTEADKYTTLSNLANAEGGVTKLQNLLANYSLRSNMYYITAPQNGYVSKAIQSGIGETIKEGDQIISIMPSKYDLAIEMYVKPIDLPLLEKGQLTRVQFDGWPAIVFSGWPNTSKGTFGGKVYAIDNFISSNGLFRIFVQPDPKDTPWPKALRVGAGTRNMILLKDVPIWYELWRNINGFPPEYYKNHEKRR